MKGTSTAAPSHPHHFVDLNHRLVQLVAAASTVAAGALAITAFTAADSGFLSHAVASVVVAGVAGFQLLSGRESARVLLGVTAVVILANTTMVDVAGRAATGSTALAIVGMVGSLFIVSGIRLYVVLFSLVLVGANLAWYDDTAAAIVGAVVASAAFTSGVLVFTWLRRRLEDVAHRFRHLFGNAPVSIWEEDFSKVGMWLDELRAQGVVDLARYLEEHPEVLEHAAGLIEVHAVNDAAVELLEADHPADLVGNLNPATLTPEALESLIPQLVAVWNNIDRAVLEVREARTLRDNRIDGLLSWTAPRTREGGLDLTRVIVSIVDVTGLRRAADDLEELVRSRNELVATVSHELRTPLTTVVGLAQELRDSLETFTAAEIADLVDLIAEQAGEVAAIVDDLLVTARSQGSLGVSIDPVDLALETRATLEGLGLDPREILTSPDQHPVVKGDAGRVRQILRNLLTNARRYGGDNVRVVLRAGDTFADAEVRDDGPPLRDDEAEMIFLRYHRSLRTSATTSSVGLGLAVSRDLAHLMGGDLTYQHDGETVFTLRLPLREATGDGTTQPGAEGPPQEKPRRPGRSRQPRLPALDSRL